jgi:mannosyltransferase
MLLAPPVVTLALMLWGIAGPSYTFDESDTLSATSRTIPQLFRMLGTVDAVHGLYYLLLWPVVHAAGSSEFETRLPSAAAMAGAAFGIAAIGRRARSRRTGLYAGLLFAIFPAAVLTGHNARPYPLEVAIAVLTSYLLLRVAGDPRPRWLVAYGGSLVLLGYMHLFGLLIIPAHAVTLVPAARAAGARRAAGTGAGDTARPGDRSLTCRWLVTAAISGALTVPVIWFGWLQRGQITWIPRPAWKDLPGLAVTFAGTTACAVVIGALIVLGAVRADGSVPSQMRLRWPSTAADGLARWPGEPGRSLFWLAVPWLLLPPAILLLASLGKPVYQATYVIYCLPAFALLAGAGLAALSGPLPYTALALIMALLLPTQAAIRGPDWGIARLRQASQILASHERPGDAVYYPGSTPTWYLCYPSGFAHLRNIALRETPGQAGRLVGPEQPLPVIEQRLHGVQRLWVIEQRKVRQRWVPVPLSLGRGFRLERQWKVGAIRLRLYVRATASAAGSQK